MKNDINSVNNNNTTINTFTDSNLALQKIGSKFFGVEYQAEKCLNKINVFLRFPDLMQQPLIMNFWGPTGTGKTELVDMLLEATGLKDRLITFNLANIDRNKWDELMNDISRLVYNDQNIEKPVVLFFDEIQHARAIDEDRKELNRKETPELWEILDKGIEKNDGDYVPTIIFTAGNINLYDAENVQEWEGLPNEEDQQSHIPVQYIHEALAKRFRPEMLARLRNNHYLFPPINKKRALMIIERDLKHTEKILSSYISNLKLRYDKAFLHFLFNKIESKGMGARGVESCFNDAIHSNISQWLLCVTNKGFDCEDIAEFEFEGHDDEILVGIKLKNGSVLQTKTALKTDKSTNTQEKPDEIAVYAVHESGHALAAFLTSGITPQIISVGSGLGSQKAFVKFHVDTNLTSKRDIFSYAAQSLGGLLAEELIFGSEMVTHGSSADLNELYKTVSHSLLEAGHGNSLLVRKLVSDLFETAYPQPKEADLSEVEAFINTVAKQTRLLFTSQKECLQKLAEQLFYRGELTTESFLDIVNKTINKEALATFHGISHTDKNGNVLHISKLIDRISFSYTVALFGDKEKATKAKENLLIGSKKAREKSLSFPIPGDTMHNDNQVCKRPA